MTAENFPDRPVRPGSPVPPATIKNVDYVLAQAGIKCRYNEVKKKVEVNIPGHKGTAENLDEVTFIKIKSLCAERGMPTGSVGEYVNAIANQHAYNPVADWIRSKPWDGTDRLPNVCTTVVEQPDYPQYLKPALMRKWLRSAAAAAAIMPGYRGRGVLTFQGQQGIGKTSWVKALVTDSVLRDSVVKLDHHLDSGNKDSILGAIDNWIVEIGELDSSFKKDVARLKGFITSDSDRLRRPYARTQSEYPRRTLFVATVNDPNFLVDSTGNSRWWTIAVDSLDYRHTIDMQQVFAQMAVEIERGGEWWLNEHEEALLAHWNARHVATSVVADRINEKIEHDVDKQKNIAMLTPTDMLLICGITSPTNGQAKECAAVLRELFGQSRRIQGRDKWRVPLREPIADDLEVDLRKRKTKTIIKQDLDKEVF